MDLNKLSRVQLLEKCKEYGLSKYNSKTKLQLIELIKNKNTNSEDDYLLGLLKKLIEKYSLKKLTELLNIARGTILRWIELKNIPKNYEFDILKLSDIKIDYSKYTTKEKDQFFTPINTVKKCFQIFLDTIEIYEEKINNYKFIEPSAGDGSFLSVLPDDTIAMDIEPRHEKVMNYDFLEWKPKFKKDRYIVFGNPPFGLRGHMALRFINHSYEFADYVCFILPQLFESDGKGVPRKRVYKYNLISSTKIESEFYEPDGNLLKINTIFQIWSKYHKNELYDIKKYDIEKVMKIYSLSNGGTKSSTRNKDMIGKCDIYIPSTCFGKEYMKCYHNFEELPNQKGYGIVFYEYKKEMISKMLNIKWDTIAFLSTNSAYNLRSSQIYSVLNKNNLLINVF